MACVLQVVNDLVTKLEHANITCPATFTFAESDFKDQLRSLRVSWQQSAATLVPHVTDRSYFRPLILSDNYLFTSRLSVCFISIHSQSRDNLHKIKQSTYKLLWVGIAQSVQLLATGWTVRRSNPDGWRGLLHPEILWVPGFFTGGKAAGPWR